MLPPLGEVPRSGNGVSKRTGAQGAIATEHPVRRHPAQSVCICGASRCQQSPFSKGGCHVVTEEFWWALWAKPITISHGRPQKEGSFMCSPRANLGRPRRSSAGPAPRWAALFWEESLLQSQLHVTCVESLGFQSRRSRGTSTLNVTLKSFFFAAGCSAFLTAGSQLLEAPTRSNATQPHTSRPGGPDQLKAQCPHTFARRLAIRKKACRMANPFCRLFLWSQQIIFFWFPAR